MAADTVVPLEAGRTGSADICIMSVCDLEELFQSANEITDFLVLLLHCMAKILSGHNLAHGVQPVCESCYRLLVGLLLRGREKVPFLNSPPASWIRRSSGVQPFQSAALCSVGNQLSSLLSASSPVKLPTGGAFPCRTQVRSVCCTPLSSAPCSGSSELLNGKLGLGLLPQSRATAAFREPISSSFCLSLPVARN